MPDAYRVLAFDTSAAHCAAALLSGDEMIAEHFEARARGQAEALFPVCQTLLASKGWDYADLDGIAVGTGPGNFTGLRIAISAARGLALGLRIPAIGISAFEVAAERADPETREIFLPGPRGSAYRMSLAQGDPSGAAELRADVPCARLSSIDWASWGIETLGKLAVTKMGSAQPLPRPAPLYVRPADAAPARDPAPVILP